MLVVAHSRDHPSTRGVGRERETQAREVRPPCAPAVFRSAKARPFAERKATPLIKIPARSRTISFLVRLADMMSPGRGEVGEGVPPKRSRGPGRVELQPDQRLT